MIKPSAIITGASSGIGKSLAIELSEKYFIYLVSRDIKKLENTKKIIHRKKNEGEIITADLTSEKSVKEIYNKISNKNNI